MQRFDPVVILVELGPQDLPGRERQSRRAGRRRGSIGFNPQHIDSRQHALQYRVSNWASWTGDNQNCNNSGYRVVKHSNTDYTFEEL